jgi:hypothetical protein
MRLRTVLAGCAIAALSASFISSPSAAAAENTLGAAPGVARAVPGSTAQRRAAWSSLSSAKQQQVRDLFKARVTPEIQKAARAGQNPRSVEDLLTHKGNDAVSTVSSPLAKAPVNGLLTVDNDFDGLDDKFENSVADAFTPFYHISAGELPGTGFAIHADSVPQTSITTLPAIPPVSDFRVQPLGFAFGGGTQFGLLRIDYLTLWNRDDGLDLGCVSSTILDLVGIPFSDVVRALTGHPEEQERSAVLVAAPVPAPNTFNDNAAAYSAYDYFTTAHEGIAFFDQSTFLTPSSPVPAGNHLQLGLARSKHGTYAGNPDGHPDFQPAVIAAAFATIDFLYFDGIIDDITYFALQFLADDVFFGCVVEHFSDQGGFFAGTRTNIGEPGHAINQSGYIEDPKLRVKLTTPLWLL